MIPHHKQELDWNWASRAQEDNCIAQTRNSSLRRRWSNWILEIFPNSVHWSVRMWIDDFQEGEERKKRFSSVMVVVGQKFFTSELSKVIGRKSYGSVYAGHCVVSRMRMQETLGKKKVWGTGNGRDQEQIESSMGSVPQVLVGTYLKIVRPRLQDALVQHGDHANVD